MIQITSSTQTGGGEQKEAENPNHLPKKAATLKTAFKAQ